VAAIARGCQARRLLPLSGGSALRGWNSVTVLDSVAKYLPPPRIPPNLADHPGAGLVFQTTVGARECQVIVARVVAGGFSRDAEVWKAHELESKDVVRRIYQVFADELKEVERAEAGDIVALEVGQHWMPGDTILASPDAGVRFEADHKARLVLEVALEATAANDHRGLRNGLIALTENDSGIEWAEELETGRCILRGQGELQLEIALEMLRDTYTASFKAWPPHVRHRERLLERVGPVSERGDWAGQWLELRAAVEPAEEGTMIVWETQVSEGIRAATEAGIHEVMGNGQAGRGSLEGAVWKVAIAGESEAPPAGLGKKIMDHLGAGMLKAAGVRIEVPAAKAEIQTPDEHLGAILACLKTRGVEIQAIDTQRNGSTIRTFSPLEHLLGCANLFRSLSKGQATLSLEPSGWVVESA